jgi:cell division protein FtsQ
MREGLTKRIWEFFRRDGRGKRQGEERLQGLLKKSLRLTSQLLLLSVLLFSGHWIYAHLLEDPFFRVREVEIEGCRKISQEAIRSLIMIEGMPNLFTLRLEEIARRLEKHPWIDRVVMTKVFPHKVKIQIEERKPIAILQLEEFYYIDAKGVIFCPAKDGDGYNFPFLTGLTRKAFEGEPEASKDLIMKALEFLSIIEREKPSALEEVSEIHMSRSFGIDCYARANGLEVKMGKGSFGEKLRRLSIIWSDLRKRGLSVMSIDCNDLNKMVVTRFSPRARWERR